MSSTNSKTVVVLLVLAYTILFLFVSLRKTGSYPYFMLSQVENRKPAPDALPVILMEKQVVNKSTGAVKKREQEKHMLPTGNSTADSLRYVTSGLDINCKAEPVDTLQEEVNKKGQKLKFAYAWYVSSNHYLCSALVAMMKLKEIRKEVVNTDYNVQYVAVFSKPDFPGFNGESEKLFAQWKDAGKTLFSLVTLVCTSIIKP